MKKTVPLALAMLAVGAMYSQNTLPTTRVTGSMNVDSTVVIHDSLHVMKDMQVNGAMKALGSLTMAENATAEKDLTVSGSLEVGGSSKFVGRAAFQGDALFNSQLNLGINFGVKYFAANGTIPQHIAFMPTGGGYASALTSPIKQACSSFSVGTINSFVDLLQVYDNTYTNQVISMGLNNGDGILALENIPQGTHTGFEKLRINPACKNDILMNEGGGITGVARQFEVGLPPRDTMTMFHMLVGHGLDRSFVIRNYRWYKDEIFAVEGDGQTTINHGGGFTAPAFVISSSNPKPNDGGYPPFFTVMGDGKLVISKPANAPDNDAIVIKAANSSAPNFKVRSDGSVYARYMKVSMATFPDYVFDKNYKLRSLKEVEAYINEHKHLPNVPAAATVEKEGADLGELQRVNMEKTEELFLYLIEVNKRLEKLEAENSELKAKLLKN